MTYAERKAMEADESGDKARGDFWRGVKAEVDKAPPLTIEQQDLLRVLLRPSPAGEYTTVHERSAA